jgi:sarcosine oxidase/L-pipecolate oxidase
MEGSLEPRLKHSFRWRPETAVDRDWEDTQGRFGGPNAIMDVQKVKGWTSITVEEPSVEMARM